MPHPIPDAALETDIATIGLKGSGKSVTNRGLVERLLDQGRRVVILDPLGHWWGLKAKADGSEGYPVAVIGGEHADVPLDPAGGVALGEHLAASDLAVVVDVSELKKTELIRFATDFLGALYRVNRRALWLVLEESDILAPQQPSTDGTRNMLDACDMIARRGRARGFRLWTMTQRPARLAKDLLTQASTLITLRITGPQDRAAIEDWMLGHVDSKEAKPIIQSLASLEVGEGWVLNSALGMLERTRFPMCKTLDTSATPKANDAERPPISLAKADLRALEALLGPGPSKAVEPQKAAPAQPQGRDAGSYEAGVRDGRRLGLQAALAEFGRAGDAVRRLMGEKPAAATGVTVADTIPGRVVPWSRPGGLRPVDEHLRGLERVYDREAFREEFVGAWPAIEMVDGMRHVGVDEHDAGAAVVEAADRTIHSVEHLGKAAASMLKVICRHHPVKLNWTQVCQLDGGRATDGGSFNTARKQLRERGFIAETADAVLPLEKALEAFPPSGTDMPFTDRMQAALPTSAQEIFKIVRERGPITTGTIGVLLGKATRGGSWNTAMATLRRNNLIRVAGDVVTLSDWIRGQQ